MNFGPKAPTPQTLKEPTQSQKSTHQQLVTELVVQIWKKKLLVKIENLKIVYS